MLVDLSRPGLRVEVPGWSPEWTIRPDRLILAEPKPYDGGAGTDPTAAAGELSDAVDSRPVPDCGAVMARVLTTLPETPVTGVGNTFRFTGPLSEADPATNPELPAGVFPKVPPTPAGAELRSSGFGYEFTFDGATVTASFSRITDSDSQDDAI